MSNRVLIDQTTNTVNTDQCPEIHNSVVVNNEIPSNIDVIENVTNIITVTVPGPQGPQGPNGAEANISGSNNYIPIFSGSDALVTSSIYQSGSFTAIGTTSSLHPNAPETLLVNSLTDSYNLISGHANIDNYVQLNIKNFSGGPSASSDIVATADIGDEESNYINMGINGSNYTAGNAIGGALDAYLYNTGENLYIGNTAQSKQIVFFNGGFDVNANAALFIHDQGTITINTAEYNETHPPSLGIQAPNSTTNTLIEAVGNTNQFLQLALSNQSSGSLASSDIVAYNNIDPTNQAFGFIDMGINSTNFDDPTNYPGWIGGHSYVFSDAPGMIIGSTSGSSQVNIFAGGVNPITNSKLVIRANNIHSLTGSLEVTGSITSSLFGTASWALNAITASYVPASGVVGLNLSQISTGSVTASVNIGSTMFSVISGSASSSLVLTNNGFLTNESSGAPYYRLSNNNNNVNLSPGQAAAYIEVIGKRAGTNGVLARLTTTYIGDGTTRNSRFSIGTAEGTGFGGSQISIYKLSSGPSINQQITVIGTGVDAYSTSSVIASASYTSRANVIINGASVNNIVSFDSNGTSQALVFNNGNWGINTTVDNGFKFDISGSARVQSGLIITGSLIAPDITGSLLGTASWAQNALTASFGGNFTASNALITNTLTAQTLVVQTITSSTDFVTGSTRFGSLLSNTHQFTGSVSITGSLTLPYLSTGSVLFAGATDNIAEDNTNLFWDNTNKRLGIGTNAPSAKFDVYSTSLAQSVLTVGESLATRLSLNQSSVRHQLFQISRIGGSSTALLYIGAGSGPTSTSTIIAANNDATLFGYDASNIFNETFRITTTKNLLLGTTSDTGERLQVSGSSKFVGDMVISGSGATSATNGLTVVNSSGTSTLTVRNDGRISNGDNTFYVDRYAVGGTTMVLSVNGHNGATGIQVANAVGIRAYSNLGVSVNNALGASIYAAGGNTNAPTNISLGLLSNRALITSVASGMNMHTSSMLQVDSTDQGFLVPRMTAAQRTAIGTPARGLLVYDIDSTTEGLWFYNSGSNPGWQEVLTNSGSQSISGSITATSFTGSLFGTASWAQNALTASFVSTTSLASNFFAQGGNSFGTTALLGTNDSQSLAFETSGSVRMFISGSGDVGIGTATPAYKLDVNGNFRAGNISISANEITNPATDGYIYIGSSARTGGTGGSNIYYGSGYYAQAAHQFYGGTATGMTSVVEIFASQASKPALRVFGSSSFAGNMVITGSGATFATNALTVNNSSGGQLMRIQNDGATYIGSGNQGLSTVNLNIAGAFSYLICTPASGYSVVFGTYTSFTPSAVVEINSTSRGFLLPRMTEAQRLAISSPAQGLLVYDTGSATEGLWYYNSGSTPGWQEVLTNTGSQSILGGLTATSFTGSLFGTSSWTNNAVSASQATTASSADNFTVRGTLTAQTIVVQTITSSTDFVSGSTIFGNNLSNTHQFTGSVSMTGSLAVVGNVNISGSTTLKSLSGTGSISIAPGSDSLLTLSGFYNVGQTNLQLSSGGSDSYINSFGSGNRLIITNNSGITFTAYSSATQYMHVSSGGVIIGGNSTTPTARLDVSGSSRFAGNMIITGSGTTSATNALTINNSGGSPIFQIRNDSAAIYGGAQTGIFCTTDKGQSVNGGAGGLYLGYFATGDLGYTDVPSVTIGRPNNRLLNATSGTQIMGSVVGNYSPTSGTGLFRAFEIVPTINQTGGANGITRGLIISPTITAAADFRAIEWTNNAATAPSASWGLYGAGTAPNFLSGSLSIGTTSSLYKLEVAGDARIQNSLLIGSTATGFTFSSNTITTYTNSFLGIPSDRFFSITDTSFTSVYFRVIRNTGAILIGTTTDDGVNRLQVSGSSVISGSLTVTQGITGSLFGTASWAQNAVTASYALTAQTLLGSVVSASYAATASYATSFYVSGTLNVGKTNIEFQENTNVTSGTWRVVSSEPTASYKAAFFDYVMFSGSIARAGTVYSVWSASYAEYYENYTGDVGGSTAGVSLQAAISGSNIQLQATASNNGWTIRSLVRML